MTKGLLISFLVLIFFGSCTVVKEYEKVQLRDPDMKLADKKTEQNIKTFHSYREGSSGANGGKTGGGCGCN